MLFGSQITTWTFNVTFLLPILTNSKLLIYAGQSAAAGEDMQTALYRPANYLGSTWLPLLDKDKPESPNKTIKPCTLGYMYYK